MERNNTEKRLYRGETTLHEEGTTRRRIILKRYNTKGLYEEKLHRERTIWRGTIEKDKL